MAIVVLAFAIYIGVAYVSMENRRVDVEKADMLFRQKQIQWQNQQQIRRHQEEEKSRDEAKTEERNKMMDSLVAKNREAAITRSENARKSEQEFMQWTTANMPKPYFGHPLSLEPNTPEPNIP